MASPRSRSQQQQPASEPVFKGDVSPQTRDKIRRFSSFILTRGNFARTVGAKVVLEEVEVRARDKDGKMCARVTYATVVDEDMLNVGMNMHGGCAVYLIDICSSVALTVLAMVTDKPHDFVSQALNTTFHAPAPAGAKLEIVNTTLSFGSRIVSTITEIWDVTNGRLCMTGVHHKMSPSKPPEPKL